MSKFYFDGFREMKSSLDLVEQRLQQVDKVLFESLTDDGVKYTKKF